MTEQVYDDVNAGIAELGQVLLSIETVEEFLRELAVRAAGLVAGGLCCGMTLGSGKRTFTVACSNDVAAEVDEVQYDLDEGPCLEAMRSQVAVRVDNTSAEARWSPFGQRAACLGVHSVLALPLSVGGEPAGALNFYACVPAAFREAERRRAQLFAERASGALAVASRLASYAELTGQLRTSLASRAVIDQAVGVLMAQERCSQEKAFAILRGASQNRNVKLRQLAAEIVTSVSGEPPVPPPFEYG